MKLNKLDLAKIISDFIFIHEMYPEDKAKVVFDLKHTLTAHGFEKYMQYYFKRSWYKAFLNGKTNSFDWWVDIFWHKMKWDKRIKITAQCKKYSMKDITEDQVRSFVWGIYVKDKDLLGSSQSILYFITTTKFTKRAQEYASKAGVLCVDFSDIYKLQSKYNLKEFQEDLYRYERVSEVSKCISKEQLQIPFNKSGILKEHIPNRDVIQFLKQIRRDIAWNLESRKLWDVAKNETLLLLARHRPHNLNALKQMMNDCDVEEYNKLFEFGYIFMERLRYVWN